MVTSINSSETINMSIELCLYVSPRPHRRLADVAQLIDVANGLRYMHDLWIVHGDLKGVHVSLK